MDEDDAKDGLALIEVDNPEELDGLDVPSFGISELLRLGHAYLSIEDPQRRLEALRMLEAIAGAETK